MTGKELDEMIAKTLSEFADSLREVVGPGLCPEFAADEYIKELEDENEKLRLQIEELKNPEKRQV